MKADFPRRCPEKAEYSVMEAERRLSTDVSTIIGETGDSADLLRDKLKVAI